MSEIEKYLIDSGWIRYNSSGEICMGDNYLISGISNTNYSYKSGDDLISYGLYEYGYPPTLITRLNIRKYIRDGVYTSEGNRSNMDLILSKFTPSDIIESIINGYYFIIDFDESVRISDSDVSGMIYKYIEF